KPRENLTAALGHDHHIFMPDAAKTRIIKTRLHRDYLSIFQHYFLQPRIFMNLQPEAVTGAMEKSDVLTVSNFRGVVALLEQRLDRLVNFHSVDTALDFAKCQFLPVLHRLPKFSLRFAGAPAH